jgi:Putative peptidoglycan binding domain
MRIFGDFLGVLLRHSRHSLLSVSILAYLLLFAGGPLYADSSAAKDSKAKPASHNTAKSAHSSVTKRRATSTSHKTRLVKSRRRKGNWRTRGQQKISPDRAEEIQTALIREHYMKGEPSGKWDSATQSAMQRYQADHGWQTKSIPDARALIKLGLGPDQEHLLNPASAMTAQPVTAHPAPVSTAVASDSATRQSGDPPAATANPQK